MVTFGRAGEDKKFSKLGDVEATLQGFAGADYDLQVHSLFCVCNNMFQHILHVDSSLDLPHLVLLHAGCFGRCYRQAEWST